MYLGLHSPGCGVEGELCSPHPMGIDDAITTIIENPELFAVWLGLAGVVVAVAVVQRYRKEGSIEG
jgi:hypothetical protein